MATKTKTTKTGTIIGLERMNCSRNGNPRFRIIFDDGTTATTAPDASLSYSIGNYGERFDVVATFDGRGNVTHLQDPTTGKYL